MILGVSGLGNTGSMALIDLLREYDEVFFNTYLGEFSLCYLPDGLLDLEAHIVNQPCRFQSSDIAIKRFENLINWMFADHKGERLKYNSIYRKAAMKFIDDITQISWQGTWSHRIQNKSDFWKFFHKVLFKVKKIFGSFGENLYCGYVKENMRYSARSEEFGAKARQFLQTIIDTAGAEGNKINLIDMAFPGDNPETCFHFFEDPYAIIVDRDPRDLYILSKYYIHTDSLWIPTDNVDDYIFYFRNMRLKADPVRDKSRVLKIQYEDLIYNYESIEKTIQDFLGIKNHKNKGKYFKREESINNTQLFEQFPEEADNIKRIDKELNEWIFDFTRFEKFQHTKKAW